MEHKVYMNYIHPSSLLRQLSDLWKANKMCDAIITVGNVHVAKAHKVVLIAASPKLKSFDLKSSSILKVSLPSGISHQTVHIFLRYIYEGYLILTPKSAEDLLKIATFLNIICLANCCKDVLNSFENSTIVLPEKIIENRDVEFCHFRKSEVEKFVEGQNDCDNREITDHNTKTQITDDGMYHKNRQSPIPSQSSHSPPSDCSARTSETENIAIHLLDALDQSISGSSQIKIEQEDDIPGGEISDVTGSTLKQPRLVSEACPKSKKRKLSSTEMNPTLQTFTSKNSPSSSVLLPSENQSNLLPIQLVQSSASDIGEDIQQGTDQQHSLFFVQNRQSGEIVFNDKARTESTVQHPVETPIKTEPLCNFSQATDNNNSSDLQEAASSSDVPGVSKSSVPPKELSLEPIKIEPKDKLDQTLTSASDGEQGDYDGQTVWFSGDSVQHASPSHGIATANVAHGSFQQRSMTSLTQTRAQQSIKCSIQSSVSAAKRDRSMGGISESVSSPGDQADQSFSSDSRDLSNEISTVDRIIEHGCRDLPSEEEVHDCEECPETFASIHGLENHVFLKHTKAHNYCNLCGKGFAPGYEFKLHMANHQDDFKHDCPSCDKKFSYKRELLRHLRVIHHSDGFKCEKCNRTYSTSQILRKHEKARHGRKSETSVTVPTEIHRTDVKEGEQSLSTFTNQMPSTSRYSVVESVKASPHSHNIQQQHAGVPQPTSVFEHSISSTSNLKSNTSCESDDLDKYDDLDNSDDVLVLDENDFCETSTQQELVPGSGVQITKLKLSAILSHGSLSMSRMTKLLLSVFFNDEVLATSNYHGNGGQNKSLDKKITSAIKDFVQQRFPGTEDREIVQKINEKCSGKRKVLKKKLMQMTEELSNHNSE